MSWLHWSAPLASPYRLVRIRIRGSDVIVGADGATIGEGAHVGPGNDHAEVVALKSATADVKGATAYVTLEPCSHPGRTPPCADALIEAGIGKVVVGVLDPDERVSGNGIEKLRNAHRRTGMPLITLKAAMTLDGNMAAADGTSQWITSEESRKDGHQLRANADTRSPRRPTVAAYSPTSGRICVLACVYAFAHYVRR